MKSPIVNHKQNLVKVLQKQIQLAQTLCLASLIITLTILTIAFRQYQRQTSTGYIHYRGLTLQVLVQNP